MLVLKNLVRKNWQVLRLQNFPEEIQELARGISLTEKNLRFLNPIILEDGLVRMGGILDNADIPYKQKNWILLPTGNWIVSLLLLRMHVPLCYAGSQKTLSNIRLQYWPLRDVKRIILNWVTCFRFKAQSVTQIMAHLLKEWVLISRPFQETNFW